MTAKKKVVQATEVMVDGVMVNADVYEAGLAQGLDVHATENANHAMGVKETPIDAAIQAAARAPKAVKAPKVAGSVTKTDGSFSARATHEGKFLMATDGKHRKAGDAGEAGLEWLHEEYVVSYEAFAALHPVNHLNWDINRGWVKLISASDAADLLGEENDDELSAYEKEEIDGRAEMIAELTDEEAPAEEAPAEEAPAEEAAE